MSYPGRPSGYLDWGISGGSSAIVEPSTIQKTQGWSGGQKPPAQYFNWIDNRIDGWIKYLDSSLGVAFCGDASNGDLILGATTYVMSRHMQFADLAVGPSSILDTNGWVPFVRGVLTGVSGTIRCNGATGGTGAVVGSFIPGIAGAGPSGPLGGGIGGGTGPLGIQVGESPGNALGGAGGNGGSGSIASGLAGGTAILPSGVYSVPPASTQGLVHWQTPIGVTSAYLRGGAGGGAGGHGSSGAGGGGAGGGGAGVIQIVAQEVNFRGLMQAKGGGGGVGGGGGGNQGGGGGGAGGAVRVTYGRKTLLSVTVDVAGGAGGSGFGPLGLPGATGGYGATALVEIQLAR